VKVAPTLETNAERYSPETFKIMELLYVLRCLNSCLPETSDLCNEILGHLSGLDLETISEDNVQHIIEALNKLRGLDASISSIVSAASKIFFSVDGMAFDDFSVNLSVSEWEIITEAMNKIRLDFSQEIKEMSSSNYHFNTTKAKKLSDKKDLDQRINNARGPLLQILKLNKDDLHQADQLNLLKGIKLSMSSKKIRFERKAKMALLKTKVLEAYRSNKNLDVLKYVQETELFTS
jgi:hypothetical protein